MFDENYLEKLKEMSQQKISDVDKNTLVDINTVKIDASLPIQERMMKYLEQIKNPYCFLCEGIIVKTRFAEIGKTLDEAITNHFIALKT